MSQSGKRHIRVFVSSPSDVSQERKLALDIIDQLPYSPLLRDKVTVEAVAWDKPGAATPMLANMIPQEAVNQGLPQPSECDIVVVIFWSRMGTPLTARYTKPDGSPYLSGTEWEYWDAYNAAKANGKPLLIVYRRTESVHYDPDDPDFVQKGKQWFLVKDFFARFTNPDGSLEQGYNTYEKPDDFRRAFEKHLETLVERLAKEAAAAPAKTVDKPLELWNGSPFPGLRAFTAQDAPIFFGRGRETDALVRSVEASRLVAVIGASGSGKSSLVGAGLIVRLGANALSGSKDWAFLRFTPGEVGDNPFLALAVQLSPLVHKPARELAAELEKSPASIEQIILPALADKPEWAEVMLFIDQFEELFTLVDKKYLPAFVAMLDTIVKSRRLRAVVTMRSDFYHHCIDIPLLAEMLRNGSYPLAVPGQIALFDMITRPAERAALTFEEGLAEQILRDTGEDSGSLALMAYALDELYHLRDSNGVLTHRKYEELGGVQGAIGKRAEKAFNDLDDEARAMLPQVFRELVEVDDRGTATRHRATYQETVTTEASVRMVDTFTAARLLVRDNSIVEVAHEALLRSWPRLADWIGDVQDDLRLLKQVRLAATEWDTRGRRKDYLWSHERLEPVYRMVKRLEVSPDSLMQEFIRPEHERLLEELRDPTTLDYRRQSIADRLAQIGEPALAALLDTLQHRDKWVRAAALRSLIQLREKALPGLVTLLIAADLKTAKRIARGLVAMGEVAVPGLVKALREASADGRYAAADALDLLSSQSAAPGLLEALTDTDARVRRAASTALTRLGSKAVWTEAIARLNRASLFREPDWGVRSNLVWMLGHITDKTAVPNLIAVLHQDEHPEVRREAAAALGLIADVSAQADLALVVESDETWQVCSEAILALGKLRQPSTVPLLTKKVRNPNPAIRVAVVKALGDIADPTALDTLRRLISVETEPQIRTLAQNTHDRIFYKRR